LGRRVIQLEGEAAFLSTDDLEDPLRTLAGSKELLDLLQCDALLLLRPQPLREENRKGQDGQKE
jgi:hypothetical protein